MIPQTVCASCLEPFPSGATRWLPSGYAVVSHDWICNPCWKARSENDSHSQPEQQQKCVSNTALLSHFETETRSEGGN